MSFVDPLILVAKQLSLQMGLQANSFIDHLVKEGLVSRDEVGRLKGVATREGISGWMGVLRFLRSKHPSRGLDALQSMIGKEDALSRDVLSRLQHLWISGTEKAAIFLNAGSFQVLHPQDPITRLELPKSHVASVVLTRKVMEMLGFKIVEVELAQETKADELTRQFHELGRSLRDNAVIFVCISGVLTTFQDQGMLLSNNAVLHWDPAQFKPVGIPTRSIAHCLSLLPYSSVTCFVDCLPFHLVKDPSQMWKPLYQTFTSCRNRQQSVCIFDVSYKCTMNTYLKSLYGTQQNPHHKTVVESSYGQAMGVFANVVMEWSKRACPRLSNYQVYNTVAYRLSEWSHTQYSRLDVSSPFLLLIQGDKCQCFLGSGVVPYQRWHKSRKVDVLEDKIVVPIAAGRAFKFAPGEAALVHHPLAPEKIVVGEVTEVLGQFNSKVVINARHPFFHDVKGLVVEGHQKIAGGGFLCVSGKGNPRFKVVIDKTAAKSRPEDVRKLLEYVKNQSLMLECSVQDSSAEVSGLDVSYSVTVNPDTNEFVVEDQRSSMMRVFEPSGDHLKRVLEEMAHFSLGMNLTHVFPPEYKYKCCLLQDAPLLRPDTVVPTGVIKVSASSEKGDNNRALDGVLGVPGGSVWKPAASTDTEYLQFEFPMNHSIASMEIRGDIENEEFVTKFNLSCAPQVREAEKISLTPDESSTVIHTGSEDALGHRLLYTSTRYVEIQPHRWSNPTARLMVTVTLHGDVPVKGIHIIGAHNLIVEPETARRRADVLEGGSVVLTAAPDQPGHKISLDFEKVVHVKTIKLQAIFDSPDEPENIIAATLVFIGAWTTTAYEGNTSIWSKRLTLEEPLIGFRFRFTPLAFKKGIAMKIQMNGSPVSSIAHPLYVEEDSHLQLHLSVEKNKETTVQGSGRLNPAVYFYVFLFEYTGTVSLLSWEYLQPGARKIKHIKVYMSKDLPPDIEDILDTYRVISCTKELNLHSLLQKGPLEYTEPQDYTFVLPESGPNIKDSEWDVVDLPVRVHRKRGGFMKW